jgi:hypothetical protein
MCFTHQNTVVFLLNLLDVIAQKHNKIISLLFMLMELDCLLTVATSGLIIHPPHDMSMNSNGGMTMTEKPVPMPLCPPQILHGLTQMQILTFSND